MSRGADRPSSIRLLSRAMLMAVRGERGEGSLSERKRTSENSGHGTQRDSEGGSD